MTPVEPLADRRDWDVRSATCGVISADGRRFGAIVATSRSDCRLMVRDAATGRGIVDLPLEAPRFSGPSALALSPDGGRAAIGFRDGTLQLVDTRSAGTWRLAIPARAGRGHDRGISCCALSPNGSRLVSGSADRTLKIWDAASGRHLRTLLGHQGDVTGVTFSLDGRRVLSCSGDGTLRLWDATSGKCLLTLQGEDGPVRGCAISPDGSRLAAATEAGLVRLWNAADGTSLASRERHLAPAKQVAFSPDASRVLSTGSDETLRIVDARSGAQALRVNVRTTWGSVACAFADGGAQVLSLHLGSRTKRCELDQRDARTGRRLGRLGQWDDAPGFAGVDIEKTDWRAKWTTYHYPDPTPRRPRKLRQAAFTPDGRHVLSAAEDGALAAWDAATGAFVRGFAGHRQGVVRITLSRDGRRMLSTTGPALRLWDVETGECLRLLTPASGDMTVIALSPDGTRLFARKSIYGGFSRGPALPCVQAWNLDTGAWEFDIRHRKNVACLAFSADGSRVATGHIGGDVAVWDAATGERLATLDGHSQDATCCTFSTDGRHVISGAADCHLKAWESTTGHAVWTAQRQRGGVLSCAASPDGRHVLSGGGNGTLKLWDARTGACLRTTRAHPGRVTDCAFSADGTRLLSTALAAKVWDAASGALLLTIPGET